MKSIVIISGLIVHALVSSCLSLLFIYAHNYDLPSLFLLSNLQIWKFDDADAQPIIVQVCSHAITGSAFKAALLRWSCRQFVHERVRSAVNACDCLFVVLAYD